MSQERRTSVRFIGIFAALVIGLTLLVQQESVNETLIRPYTEFLSELSAWILGLLGLSVEAQGTILRESSFAVDLRRGCDGVVATLVLLSAVAAFPASLAAKAVGAIVGYLLIFILNLLRIVVLFLLGYAGWTATFDFVHSYVAQFAVIAGAMVFWIFWAGRQTPEPS